MEVTKQKEFTVVVRVDLEGGLRACLRHGDEAAGDFIPEEVLTCLGFTAEGQPDEQLIGVSPRAYEEQLRKFLDETPSGYPVGHGVALRSVMCKADLFILRTFIRWRHRLREDEMFIFSEAFKGGDLAHRGFSDFYEKKEVEIKAALASGKPFDTGLRGSKHQLGSIRIWCEGERIHGEAFSTDDLDTVGQASASLPMGSDIDALRHVISSVVDAANKDMRENSMYALFHIATAKLNVSETYLARRTDDALHHAIPPGDFYHTWGFQGDSVLPDSVKEHMEDYIIQHITEDPFKPHTYRGWTLTRSE